MIADSAFWEGFWSAVRLYGAIAFIVGAFLALGLIACFLSFLFEERPSRRLRGGSWPEKSAATESPTEQLR